MRRCINLYDTTVGKYWKLKKIAEEESAATAGDDAFECMLVARTDNDDWHHALNHWRCSPPEEDGNRFDVCCESLGVGFHDIGNWDLQSPRLDLARGRVEASWERMLGAKPVDERWHFPWEKCSVQATLWTLKREHVVSVERFASR